MSGKEERQHTPALVRVYQKLTDEKPFLKHLAIITDGNGRWAKKLGLPRIAGHSQGANTSKNILRYCQKLGVKYLNEIDTEEVKINLIGDIKELPTSYLQTQIQIAIDRTKNNKKIVLNLAINYGSRQEIISDCHHLAEKIRS